jgi:hypothetical protein
MSRRSRCCCGGIFEDPTEDAFADPAPVVEIALSLNAEIVGNQRRRNARNIRRRYPASEFPILRILARRG